MLKRFPKDIKKYWSYLVYSTRCSLKSEVARSHLNWLWWVLDPLCFMLVYMFIALVVFEKGEPYFPVFVFTGYTAWSFFSKTLKDCTVAVKKNRILMTKIYFPKFLLVFESMMTYGFKMLISWLLVFVLMIIFAVPLTLNILWFFLIIPIFLIVTYGFCINLMHIGVFVDDMHNVMNVVLRVTMYLSGIFYNIQKRVDEPWNKIILYVNPLAMFINNLRNSMLYGQTPDFLQLGIWFVIGMILSVTGTRRVYKNENTYVKVI